MQKRYTQIKGISETRRLPRLGKIRLGIRTANSKGRTKDCTHKNEEYCFRCSFPKEVPYFVLPPEARAVYGDQPTEIDIVFPVDDPGTVFPQAYKLYGADQGLRCKGDGETAVRRLADVADETTKKEMLQLGLKAENLVEVPCPCPMLEAGKCGPKGCLMVMLPKVSCGGVYQIDTGSVLNLIEINSALDYLQSLLGRISMVSLKLRREPRNVTYQDPKNSKPTTKTHYLLKLVFEGAMQEVMRLRGGDRLALIGDYEIPAPVEDGPEPTGECPIEVDGEVVDLGTGEVLASNGKATPNGPMTITQTPAFRALMAWLHDEQIAEEPFKRFLSESGALPADEQGELHWAALSEVNLKGVLGKKEGCLARFRPFSEMLAHLQGEGIDMERFRDFLSTIIPTEAGKSLSLATLPQELHAALPGAIHDYRIWEGEGDAVEEMENEEF